MSEKNKESETQKCRTCYQNNGVVPICNRMLVSKVTISDMLKRCVPIQVNDLKETTLVCTSCLTTLINFYKFQEKCISVDKLFRGKLGEDNVNICPTENNSDNVIEATEPISSEFDNSPCKIISNGSKEISENNYHYVKLHDKYIVKIPKNSSNKSVTPVKKYYKLKLDDGTLTEIGDSLNTVENNEPTFRVEVDERSNSPLIAFTSANHEPIETKSMEPNQEIETIYPNKFRFPKLFNIPCPCDFIKKTKNLVPSTSCDGTRKSTKQNSKLKCDEEVNSLNTTDSTLMGSKQNPVEIKSKCEPYTTNSTIPTWISDHNYRTITLQERKQFSKDLRRYKRRSNQKIKSLPYQCVLCLDFFQNLKILSEHRVQKHKSGPFICQLCNIEYSNVKFLTRHQRYHTERPVYDKCNVCQEKFEEEELFKEHLKIHPNFICESCGKSFYSKEGLHRHTQSIHLSKYQCMCNICGIILRSNVNLKYHIQAIHEPPNTRNFVCDKCGKKYKTARVLWTHKRLTHTQSEVSCEQCGKLFRNLRNLNTHIKLIHKQEKPYKCQFCHLKFGRKDYLKNHTRTHFSSGLTSKSRRRKPSQNLQLPCKLCKKLCSSVSELRAHMKFHYSVRRYQCTHCKLTFVNKANLVRHLLIHTDVTKKFRCKICFRSCRSQEELEEHEVTHTNLKYECDVCNEKFARKYLLENHKSINHLDLQKVETEIEEKIQTFLEECDLTITNSFIM